MRRAFAPAAVLVLFAACVLSRPSRQSARGKRAELAGGDDVAALRTHLLLIIQSLSATE